MSPGSAAWHPARRLPLSCGQGNYPSFCACVCVCASKPASQRWCVCFFALKCDAFTSTIFHIFFPVLARSQPAYLTGGWLALFCFPPVFLPQGSRARHQACSRPVITRKSEPEEQHNSQAASLWLAVEGLGSGLPCVCSGCKRI